MAEPEGEEGRVGAGLGGSPMAEPEGEESGVGAGLGGAPTAAAGLGAETDLRVPAWAPPSGMMFCCGVWGQGFSGRQRHAFCLGRAGVSLTFSPLAALSPAPVPALKPAAEPEPTLGPDLEPTPALAPEPALTPAPTPPPELELALSQTLELEPPAAPDPPWPLPVATENGLGEEKPHLLAFPPDLVAEQFTLMDAVGNLSRQGWAWAPLPSGLCHPDPLGPVQSSWWSFSR